MTKNERETIAVPMEMFIPDSLSTKYATNMVVQHTEHEFIIFFFEAQPPLVIGTPEEQKEALQKIKKVKAECVAKIVVAANRMPEFVNVFQTNLRQFNKKLKKEQK